MHLRNAKKLLLIESNTSGTGADFVMRARALGLCPVLISTEVEKYSRIGFPEVAALEVPELSVSTVTGALREHGITNSEIAGVTSSSDAGVVAAAYLAQHLSLPGPDPHGIETARDKYATRIAIESSTLNPWFALSNKVSVVDALSHCPQGLIAKPVSGTGSMGFTLIRPDGNWDSSALMGRELLLEELLLGEEYSVEIIDGQCLGVTRKQTDGQGLETGHQFPAAIDVTLSARLQEAALRAYSELGLSNCAAHIELMHQAETNSIKLIEVNPRLAGGRIPDLVRLATDVDPITEAVRVATYAAYKPPEVRAVRGSAIGFVVKRSDERLIADSLEDSWNAEGVVDLEMYQHRLSESPAVSHGDFRDRVGHVLCVASTPSKASSCVEAATRRFKWQPLEHLPLAGESSLTVWSRSQSLTRVKLVGGRTRLARRLSGRLSATQHLVDEVVIEREDPPCPSAHGQWDAAPSSVFASSTCAGEPATPDGDESLTGSSDSDITVFTDVENLPPSFVADDDIPLIEIRSIRSADAAVPAQLVLLHRVQLVQEDGNVLHRDRQDVEVQRRSIPVTLDLINGGPASDADLTPEQVELITIERFIRRLHMPAPYRLSAHGLPSGPRSPFSSVPGGRL
ncbi:hypothetical protein GCM10009691_05170 [Brevibacterium picturae]|uniref:ATP-grasp domain-containing protein n=1 Tax=Brevibacterium picturae TaxID=260553 RepID=A0ABN2B4B6_9MICO